MPSETLPPPILHPNLAKLYQQTNEQRPFQCLLLGESGSGKTTSLRTARRPVLVDSFDPNGCEGIMLKPMRERGELFVRYFTDPGKGNFSKWENYTNNDIREKIPESLGTYCVDSVTMMILAAQEPIQKMKGDQVLPLEWTEYNELYVRVKAQLNKILRYPCDVILCGHLSVKIEQGTKAKTISIAANKGLAEFIPRLFNEIWLCQPKRSGNDMIHEFNTQADGLYPTKSGLGLPATIPADFTEAFKKAGRL